MSNWYIEVRNTSKPRYATKAQAGGEVTVRVDADVYAQHRLRKAIARGVARGYTLSEDAQAELLANYVWEAENGIIRR